MTLKDISKDNESKPKRIVLIDDEPGVILALKLLLQVHGFIVEAFSDPLVGLEFITNNAPALSSNSIDYILCDLRMPKKTGMQILMETRGIAGHIPFYLMSGHAEEAEQQKAIAEGAAGFLSKPFSPEDFLQLIGR